MILSIDGKSVIIDSDDFEYINTFKWFISYSNGLPYAATKTSRLVIERMHIILTKRLNKHKKGFVVDHINNNTLDNRRDNLRTITQHQNTMKKGFSKNNTSGYRGVSFDKRTGKWSSKLRFNYKTINFGRFSTKEDAAIAYNIGAKKFFGEFAVFNKIKETEND